MKSYKKCLPACFYRTTNDKYGSVGGVFPCSRICLAEYDQCMFYSSKNDQGICLAGRRGCEDACVGKIVKRGGCADCVGAYDHCILSVEQAFEQVSCMKKREQCRRVNQCDEPQ